MEKGLINGIDLHLRLKPTQQRHHPAGDIAVQGVVGGKNLHPLGLEQLLALEIRGAHGNAQGLGLVGAGNDAAVIVGQHHHRFADELRIKEPLTGGIEIIAVNQGEQFAHGARSSGGGRRRRGSMATAGYRR